MRNQGSNQGDGQSQNNSSNNRTGGFKCHCYHKVEHFAQNCPKKPSNQGREGQESANVTRMNEIALIGSEDQQDTFKSVGGRFWCHKSHHLLRNWFV